MGRLTGTDQSSPSLFYPCTDTALSPEYSCTPVVNPMVVYKYPLMTIVTNNPELKKVQERSPIQNCRPKMFPEVRKLRSIIKATKQRNYHIIAHYSSKKFPSHYHIEI